MQYAVAESFQSSGSNFFMVQSTFCDLSVLNVKQYSASVIEIRLLLGEGNKDVISKGNIWGDGGGEDQPLLCWQVVCVYVFTHFPASVPEVLRSAFSVSSHGVTCTFPLWGIWTAGQ